MITLCFLLCQGDDPFTDENIDQDVDESEALEGPEGDRATEDATAEKKEHTGDEIEAVEDSETDKPESCSAVLLSKDESAEEQQQEEKRTKAAETTEEPLFPSQGSPEEKPVESQGNEQHVEMGENPVETPTAENDKKETVVIASAELPQE